MYLTVDDSGISGLKIASKIPILNMREKNKALQDKGQAQVDKNINEMATVAERIEVAYQDLALIKASQESALDDMLKNFYGLPWEQVAILAGVGLAALYVLLRD